MSLKIKETISNFCKRNRNLTICASTTVVITAVTLSLISIKVHADTVKYNSALKYKSDIIRILKTEKHPNIFNLGVKVDLVKKSFGGSIKECETVIKDWNDIEFAINFAGSGINLCKDGGLLSESTKVKVDIQGIDKWRQEKIKTLKMLKCVEDGNIYKETIIKTLLATDKALCEAYVPLQQYKSLTDLNKVIEANRINIESWKHTSEGKSTILKVNDIINQTRSINPNIKTTLLGAKLQEFKPM